MSDDIMYDSKEDCYIVPEERFEEMEKAVAELQSIKSRLPVNADGDVPKIGDKQHFITPFSVEPKSFIVHGITLTQDGWYYLNEIGLEINPEHCHSTAESCRAANADSVPEGGK